MGIVVNIYYTGTDGSARKFAEEMESSGIAAAIRNEEGIPESDSHFIKE